MSDRVETRRLDPANAGPWSWLDARLGPELALGLMGSVANPEVEGRVYPDAVSHGVLPDPARQNRLTWVQVRARVPKAKETAPFVDAQAISSMLKDRNKKSFGEVSETLWPPRTKTDLQLRRTRLLDYVRFARGRSQYADLVEVLAATRVGFDLIFTTNLVVATLVFGIDWFRRWRWLGALDFDLTHFITCAKAVHDIGKSTGIDDEHWTYYVECATMAGYRNLPFPGFDKNAEARKLGEGGDEHNYFGHSWDKLCDEFLPMEFKPCKYVAFADFVKSASWLTGGASSVGRLELVLADGTPVSVKARKNMLADIIDLEELATDARRSRAQRATAIVKCELGKLRIAVAGDLYTYLQMTWVTYLLNGSYYSWPGNTSEEDFVSQTKRLARMLALCSRGYGLPYDYAGFDHQPTTAELVGIVRILLRHARLNVPDAAHSEFDEIASNIVHGFYNSVLVSKDGNKVETIRVTGGLMSGLRWTSQVGNAWNSVMTGLCLKVIGAWGLDPATVERFIRGDDSAIFTLDWTTAAAMNLAYDAIGAKAGAGKFSIQLNAMEFLRVWFDTSCHGYPARAIPGLTQRKAWSSQPWSEDMILRAVYETIKTLRRRVPARRCEISAMWRVLRRVWCQDHGLPEAICWTASHAGGFGFEPMPIGKTFAIRPPVPRASTSRAFTVTNQNDWRATSLKAYALERYSLTVDDEHANTVAAEELRSTVAADSVPEVARSLRRQWLDVVRATRFTVVEKDLPVTLPRCPVDVAAYPPADVEKLEARLHETAPLFGSSKDVETARSDYRRLGVTTGFTSWLRTHFPVIYDSSRRFHPSWHLSERLDYLAGKLEFGVDRLHSALTGVLAKMVAAELLPRRSRVRESVAWIAAAFENQLFTAPISEKTYSW